MKTETSCMMPVLGCLDAAQQFVRAKVASPGGWNAVNNMQKEFLAFYGQFVGKLRVPELSNKASQDVKVINAWLKSKGYDIELKDEGKGVDAFYVASILDVLMKWFFPGVKTNIEGVDGKTYPAVKLKEECGVTVLESSRYHKYPVASIETQNADTIYMTMLDEQPKSLLTLVNELSKVRDFSRTMEGVIFPMVDLDIQPDISWIEGMRISDWYIAQALQHTKFRMNELGAHVQSAAGMACKRGISLVKKVPMVIDRPFLLWIERKGTVLPLFTAVLSYDCWKQPKKL